MTASGDALTEQRVLCEFWEGWEEKKLLLQRMNFAKFAAVNSAVMKNDWPTVSRLIDAMSADEVVTYSCAVSLALKN